MKIRAFASCLVAIVGALAAASAAAAQEKPAGTGVEARLPAYLANYLTFDPASRVTVEKAPESLPGFQSYKVKRTGKYPKLAVDKTVYVSNDGKWFYDGESIANPNPRPVQSDTDVAWLEARSSALYRSRTKANLVPSRDAAGLKGLVVAVESGFGPVSMPGYITPDGARYLNGTLFDFQMDPREERKRRIDLSQGRFEGRADGAVTIVEYADMECGYCRFRGTQLDALLEANQGLLSYKRYYKFFPLWFSHAWSMKAASAAECIWRFARGAMFAFKKQVYAQQQVLTVAGIDELAVTFAEASGIPRADFLGCYLREASLADVRKDMDEGQRLGVKSTPTYFVDGTEISWTEDKVMEDYLRTRVPGLKSIDYGPPR